MTKHPSFAALESRAAVSVEGPDWRSFLQGLLTQDTEALAPGDLRFAGLLTPQGKLLFDLFVFTQENGCLLDVVASRQQALIERLVTYRLRAKVEITASPLTVSAVWNLSSAPGYCTDPRLADLGLRGYGQTAPHDAQICDEAAYQAHRLSEGVPDPAHDAEADKTYPIEANFDLLNGIDFKKGCFVGQETTSRMKRRGLIKTRMLPIRFDGAAPEPGSEILNGDLRAGTVLTGQDGRAMALLRLDRLDGSLSVDGRQVSVDWPRWMPRQD
jgi:folate-binding protein YgfZ